MLRLVLMPVITLICGLLSWRANPNDPNAKRWRYALLAGLILTAIGSIGVNWEDSSNSKQRYKVLAEQYHSLDAKNDTLLAVLRDFANTTRTSLTSIAERLKSMGFSDAAARSATAEQIATSFQANELRQRILLDRKIGERLLPSSGRPTVQYFAKDLDVPVVERSLREAGFAVHLKEPKIRDLQSNTLWVGDSVTIEDTRLAALTLMTAGVPLRAVMLFCNGSGRKASLIQLAWIPTLVH